MSEQIDPRAFRQVLGQFCTGITLITTVHDDAPIGFACQSFAALGLDPPLVLFCPTKVSRHQQAPPLLPDRLASPARRAAIRTRDTRPLGPLPGPAA